MRHRNLDAGDRLRSPLFMGAICLAPFFRTHCRVRRYRPPSDCASWQSSRRRRYGRHGRECKALRRLFSLASRSPDMADSHPGVHVSDCTVFGFDAKCSMAQPRNAVSLQVHCYPLTNRMFGVRVKKSQPGLRLRHDGPPALSRSSSSPATSAAMTTSTSAASPCSSWEYSGNSAPLPNDKEPQDMTRGRLGAKRAHNHAHKIETMTNNAVLVRSALFEGICPRTKSPGKRRVSSGLVVITKMTRHITNQDHSNRLEHRLHRHRTARAEIVSCECDAQQPESLKDAWDLFSTGSSCRRQPERLISLTEEPRNVIRH